MSTKLNSHDLQDSTIKQMKTMLQKSIDTQLESGFILCTDQKNNLKPGNMCTGDYCNIEFTRTCEKGEKYAGHYHTHPGERSKASPGDLIGCGIDHHICIGGEKDNNIKCYTWRHSPMTIEKGTELVRLYNKGSRQIDDRVYKKNFECMQDFYPLISTLYDTKQKDDKIIQKTQTLIAAVKKKEVSKEMFDTEINNIKLDIKRSAEIFLSVRKEMENVIPKYYKEKDIITK